jgi:hypothetical protein
VTTNTMVVTHMPPPPDDAIAQTDARKNRVRDAIADLIEPIIHRGRHDSPHDLALQVIAALEAGSFLA